MKKTVKHPYIILFILALVGIAITTELTVVYIKANFFDAMPSFCSINDYIDCDGVARNALSRFLGVPFSLWGMGFYVLVLFFASVKSLQAKFPTNSFLALFKNPRSYIYVFALFSVFFSIVLAYISSKLIHKMCILCYIVYALNAIIFMVASTGDKIENYFKTTFIDFFDALKKPVWMVSFTVFVTIAVSVLGVINYNGLFVPKNAAVLSFEYKNPNHKGNILGNVNGDVTVHVYADFQCKFCRISNMMMNKIADEFENVFIVHHNFTLDTKCNKYIEETLYKGSCIIAKYSIAAKKQKKSWELTNSLFENQNRLKNVKELRKIAEEAGLDLEKLETDAKSIGVQNELQEEISNARKNGITVTPSMRIGMNAYNGIMPYGELKALIIDAGGKLKE